MQQPPRHHDLLRRALGIQGPVTKPAQHEDRELHALLWDWLAVKGRSGEERSSDSEEQEA